MKFQGFINGITVHVLLDSGSSDNFLQPRVAHCLKLPIEPISNFHVLVGNGNALVAEGLVMNLEVRIQGHFLTLPVYLLPVTRADLVLGAAWLATLGPHISDYSTLTLKFYLSNQFVTLHGEQTTLPMQAQFHHLKQMTHTHAIAELFTLQFHQLHYPPEQQLQLHPDTDSELVLLWNNYKVVFSVPSGLPPSDNLLASSESVKVRPYRYPNSQKQHIEIMKKDGTWRFCTDYRALKAIIVKDSFPIPIVDELIDELHGAQFFSKLDLRSGYHQILSLMNDVFQGLLRKFKLQQHQLFAKLFKCSYGLQQVDYLGHTVSSLRVAIDKTFEELKLAITQTPVLVLTEFSKPFVLETDASGVGIGTSTYTREFYVITEAIAKFCHYLQGHRFDDIAMDFIRGLPSSNGFMVILVVVDKLSKYGHFSPLKVDYYSKLVAEIFVKSVVKLHGIPKSIVFYRDKVFLSHFWQQLFKLSGTSLNMSTTYHPQSDGQSKSLNKCLEMYLRCFTYQSPKEWAKLLPWTEYWYNTSYHHSYGMTPFKIVYDRDPPALEKYTLNPHDYPSDEEICAYCLIFYTVGVHHIDQDFYQSIEDWTTLLGLQEENLWSSIHFEDCSKWVEDCRRGNILLISVEGLYVDNATWEDQSTLQQAFSDLNLEDKVGLNGGWNCNTC
ncbi:hypothetical protein V8G54_019852 [Vigna mungo]|uniref:Integrase catalytic domain-containing protein n=1 Tax=Vigna mungo TaxID=3915 RepID=A0AAQ3NBJ3_VIGMU